MSGLQVLFAAWREWLAFGFAAGVFWAFVFDLAVESQQQIGSFL
jgi:hypothetical protein